MNETTYPKINKEINNTIGENLKKLQDIFPSAVKEGKLDITALKEELGAFEEIKKGDEKYILNWVGKQGALKEYQADLTGKTLKYVEGDGVNENTTQNIYIEGDNLEVLKLLKKNYNNEIKMIYIDPPYNTGNDFVYHDDYSISKEEAEKAIGIRDEYNEKLQKNTADADTYHSNWLNMMYPRLKIARELLADDGVIFISIDDHEQSNLKKICDEIFGEGNQLGIISVINNLKGRSDSAFFATCNEFLLVYAKQKVNASINGFAVEDEEIDNDYKFEDEISKYKPIGFRKTGNGWKREERPYMFYPVLHKDGNFNTVRPEEYKKIYNVDTNTFDDTYTQSLKDKYEKLGYEFILPTDENGNYGRWRWGLDTFFKEKDINLVFNGAHSLCTKMRATIEDGSIRVKTAKTLWYKPEYDTGTAGKILKRLFDENIFDNPKSLIYMDDILRVGSNKNSIILDFFSGSATTAHAVMQLNAEDGGNRKYIMVQLPEVTYTIDKNGKEIAKKGCEEAYKAGYKNICEIGKERIRRAGKQIQEENQDKNIDVGFKVFRVGETTLNWEHKTLQGEDIIHNYKANTSNKDMLDFTPTFTDKDVVYEIMLRQEGLPLSAKIETLTIIGSRTYYIANSLIVCLEENITKEMVEKLSQVHPVDKFIFRDSSFEDDISLKSETFNRLSSLIDKNSNKKNTYKVEFI